MKNILITGAGSYIGTAVSDYLSQFPDRYAVTTIDMVDGSWRDHDFSPYDTVYHVAGIAHQKETAENAPLYYRVNRDLAIETAKKAKASGVRQFIVLSSMSVYGTDTGVITLQTEPAPVTHYGISKWQAEQGIAPLADDSFHVCVLRPPMVYGPGCKGNYQTLVKLAKLLPILPNYRNRRSMLSIDRLAQLVTQYIDTDAAGLFFPQDEQYVCTCDMIMQIRRDMGKRFCRTSLMNPFIHLFAKCIRTGRKAFGDLIYQLDETEE